MRRRVPSRWLAAYVSCLMAISASGWAQDEAGPVPPQDANDAGGAQILNCLVDEHLPPEPAVTEEGGYRFEYQSIRGVTADARVCTLYRVRNTADHPPTPLRWTQGDELLMDKTRLARCPADAAACPWVSVAKYFEGHVDTNLSFIAYGLNADAYGAQVETFLGTVALDEARATRSVGTEVQGVFASADGEAVALHLIVKSRVEARQADGRTAVLEVTDLGGRGDLASGRLRVAWDALAVSGQAAAAMRAASAWERAGIEAGERRAEDAPPPPSAADAGRVQREGDTVEVVFPLASYELRRDLLLHVRFGDEPEPLVTVEMPAFLPVAAGD